MSPPEFGAVGNPCVKDRTDLTIKTASPCKGQGRSPPSGKISAKGSLLGRFSMSQGTLPETRGELSSSAYALAQPNSRLLSSPVYHGASPLSQAAQAVESSPLLKPSLGSPDSGLNGKEINLFKAPVREREFSCCTFSQIIPTCHTGRTRRTTMETSSPKGPADGASGGRFSKLQANARQKVRSVFDLRL